MLSWLGQPLAVRDASLCVNLDQCDLRCVMCWTTYDRGRNASLEGPREMSREQLLFLLRSPAFQALRTLSIVGGGEPFLYSHVDDLLREGPTATRRLMIMTHGGLLHQREVLWEVAASAKLTLTISIDAATPDTYSAIRRRGDWSQMIGNVERISKLRTENPELLLNASFVILRRNLDEVLSFLRLCASWGVAYVHFHPAIAGRYPGDWRVDRTGEHYRSVMSEAFTVAARHGIALDSADEVLTPEELLVDLGSPSSTPESVPMAAVPPAAAPGDPRRSCRLHSEAMTVNHLGDVYVCDTAFHVGYICGNVFREGVAAAWRSHAWRSLRSAHRIGHPEKHTLCSRCLLVR